MLSVVLPAIAIAMLWACAKKDAPAAPGEQAENTKTATATVVPADTHTNTPTYTATPEDTVTATPTATDTLTVTLTATPSETLTITPTFTNTASFTATFTPTVTKTPNPCSIIFGDDLENGNTSSTGGYLYAHPYIAQTEEDVNTIAVYFNYASDFCAGLYADDNGSPGSLLASTGVQAAGSTGWRLSPAGPVSVVLGEKYWIVAIARGPGPFLRQESEGSGFKYKAYSFDSVEASGMPEDSNGWDEDTYRVHLKAYAADCP